MVVSELVPEGNVALGGFEVIGVLGEFQHGSVLHTVHLASSSYCAVKVFSLDAVKEEREVRRRVLNEKQHLERMRLHQSPFVVSLVSATSDERSLYLGLTYVGGGDLFMRQMGPNDTLKRVPEQHCVIGAAMIVLGLEHLHAHDIIYRNLKLENVLVGLNGYFVLGDLSIAKSQRTSEARHGTLCGTPEYMAPEVLLGMPYGQAVDYWSLGVLMYELICGVNPFAPPTGGADMADTVEKIVLNVLVNKVSFPEHVSGVARGCINALLATSPHVRLGGSSLARHQQSVQSHVFFGTISWEALARKQVITRPGPS